MNLHYYYCCQHFYHHNALLLPSPVFIIIIKIWLPLVCFVLAHHSRVTNYTQKYCVILIHLRLIINATTQ
jgi:hypothetical protein